MDFHRRVIFTCVHVTRVNKIEAMYGMSRVNVRVDLRSSLLSVFMHCLYFIYARKITRQRKSPLILVIARTLNGLSETETFVPFAG